MQPYQNVVLTYRFLEWLILKWRRVHTLLLVSVYTAGTGLYSFHNWSNLCCRQESSRLFFRLNFSFFYLYIISLNRAAICMLRVFTRIGQQRPLASSAFFLTVTINHARSLHHNINFMQCRFKRGRCQSDETVKVSWC